MKTLEDALLKIKGNPNKYIGKKSLERLNFFISGYSLSKTDEEGTYTDFLKGFPEFVQQKHGMNASVNLLQIIRCFSASDTHAFDRFYELLEEYHKRKPE